MWLVLSLVFCLTGIAAVPTRAADPAICLDAKAEQRIDALLAKMTLEEKLGQLTQQTGPGENYNPDAPNQKDRDLFGAVRAGKLGSVLNAHGAELTNKLQSEAVERSRLGIPVLFGNDVIHGYRTIFPIPLGEAATWDPALIEKSAIVAATEAGAAGTRWTFAPMVDICRDGRWGRVAEGAGEDPFLGSVIAAARVRGFQKGNPAAHDALVACAKHFAAYGAPEGGRDYNTVDLSEQRLREVYLPPFKAAVDAGVGTLMSAFNDIDGVPATANPLTLRHVLREEWGFRGFVVSDWCSITEMVAHGYATDDGDAAVKAILAGVDMDMSSFSYRTHLGDAVMAGIVSEQTIDEAVRRVLRIKTLAGLFDDPYVDPALEKKVILCDENRRAARDVARHSIVLAKNEGAVLPIGERVKSIAVIGPLADNHEAPLGTWSLIGRSQDVISALEGIRKRAGSQCEVRYAKGCEVLGGDDKGITGAAALAKDCDMAIVVVGESADMSGEAHSRAGLDLPGRQLDLVKAVRATGVPMAVVLMNGRPMSISWTAENVPAILIAWHLGVECGPAIADVLFGDFNPSGKLPITFPRSVGQVPIYYNHTNTGRPPTDKRYTSKYIDLPWTPLYPFGYGLSYTQFEFSDLVVTPQQIGPAGSVKVSAKVRNTGSRAGDEIAQLYIRDLVASRVRPVKELRGFQRVSLEPGETKDVTFTLTPESLGFYNSDMQFVVEPGEFAVWIGPNSADGIEGRFQVSSEAD